MSERKELLNMIVKLETLKSHIEQFRLRMDKDDTIIDEIVKYIDDTYSKKIRSKLND